MAQAEGSTAYQMCSDPQLFPLFLMNLLIELPGSRYSFSMFTEISANYAVVEEGDGCYACLGCIHGVSIVACEFHQVIISSFKC